MQKIIIDTNILVSALISNSIPTKIFSELVFNSQVMVCISPEVIEEYTDVLSRDKFLKYPEFKLNSEIVLTRIKEIAILYKPQKRLEILQDPDDNKFLELAEISSADFLITGNIRDFSISTYLQTKIISPSDYWKNFKPK